MTELDPALIHKYNVPGPRYTSYPTAVQFEEIDGPEEVENYLKTWGSTPREISLYIHIPFCFSLCWYCGCTKVITKDTDRGDVYLNYLEKEIERVTNRLHPDTSIVQLHFGGGTPTFLRPEQLRRLGALLRSEFNLSERIEYSVEIDPRRIGMEHIDALREIGVNRASLGVQDTDPDVQEAIHRIQPFEQTANVTRWLRARGISSINFDLIYGLPRQTLETFSQTIQDVKSLHPDRLAVYSYAHIPNIMPSQKLLNPEEFPSTEEKLGMLFYTITELTHSGYRYIGLDHFAKEGDELVAALDEGTLQRNFQGYSTHAEADMMALGMSGISHVGNRYFQNTKDLNEYYSRLDAGRMAVYKQYILNRDDLLRKELIMKIMCRQPVWFKDFSKKWKIRFKQYFKREFKYLNELEKDGLIALNAEMLMPTNKGSFFLRNIAMVFDRYLPESRAVLHSKTV